MLTVCQRTVRNPYHQNECTSGLPSDNRIGASTTRYGLISSLPPNRQSILPAQYGYEVLMGFGFGLGLSTLLVLVPLVISKQDIGKVHLPMKNAPRLTTFIAVALGAITQILVLGGTVGLAIWYRVLPFLEILQWS